MKLFNERGFLGTIQLISVNKMKDTKRFIDSSFEMLLSGFSKDISVKSAQRKLAIAAV